jgi:hypothetical protein
MSLPDNAPAGACRGAVRASRRAARGQQEGRPAFGPGPVVTVHGLQLVRAPVGYALIDGAGRVIGSWLGLGAAVSRLVAEVGARPARSVTDGR